MKKWKFEIELKVSNNWIADGFDLLERKVEIEEMIQNLLPYAYDYEIQVKVNFTETPDKNEILKLQGYAKK